MTHLHGLLLILHIALGSAALMLFWVPIVTKKGQLNHKIFGNVYKNTMYAVAATGAVMAIMVLAYPLVIKHEYANHENAQQIASNLRVFWTFLLYLSLLSFAGTRHGYAVLQVKDNRALLRTWQYVAPLAMLFVGGIALILSGIARGHALHIVFGILGTLIGLGALRYIFAKSVSKRRYIIEHIGSMIGSGIGAYTAFISFGGRHFIESAGSYQIVFWMAPGLMGGIASYLMCKKYGKIFQLA